MKKEYFVASYLSQDLVVSSGPSGTNLIFHAYIV